MNQAFGCIQYNVYLSYRYVKHVVNIFKFLGQLGISLQAIMFKVSFKETVT